MIILQATGPQGEGKTTVLEAVRTLLEDHGFKVTDDPSRGHCLLVDEITLEKLTLLKEWARDEA